MIVYKFQADDNYVEINHCEKGLYISIQSNDNDEMTWQNIVMPKDEIAILIKYLQDNE